MKQGVSAVVVMLLLASASCSLFFGNRGADDADQVIPDSFTHSFRRIPDWVRPAVGDFARSEELRHAVELLERREPLSAAIQIQTLRARERWGPEVTALHAWALVDAGSAPDARRVALDGITEFGDEQPSLNYALGVAAELAGLPAEALMAYERVLARDPFDLILLRACARTALAAGRAGTALIHLERLPDSVEGSEGLELARFRAAAFLLAGRQAEAVSVHERVASAYPTDFALCASSAVGAFTSAEAANSQELRARARVLVEALTETDPQHAEAQWMLGRLAAELGDIGVAVTALRRTLELDPARVDAGMLLARLLDDTLRKDEARTVLFELLRQPLSAAQVEAVQRRILELERS
ncbi:MAG: tetratricopeptide repeat protein [Planctomycetota bacterium]|nr:tetratricopeptide repeat protein [Planctomycetota bacterium]